MATVATLDAPELDLDDQGSLHALLDRVLDEAVRLATGNPQAAARPGQRVLAHDIFTKMLAGGELAGEAPTGSGKSLAALSPALLLAALRGERAVISTETLGLQEQYVRKDVPVVVAAVASVLELPEGAAPKVAVLKGWSNYVCAAAAVTAAGEATGTFPDSPAEALEHLRKLPAGSPGSEVLSWALEEVADDRGGDRADYPGQLGAGDWETVSVSASECPAASRCRFGEVCRPEQAREAAADADVVVTNHSLLAVQAANAIPAVIGSDRLGPFDHLVVDEAHALAPKVRDQGAVSVSAFRVIEVARAVGRALVETDRSRRVLGEDASSVAGALDAHLTGMLAGAKRSGPGSAVAEVPADDDPLSEVAGLVAGWVDRVRQLLPRRSARARSDAEPVALWRAQAKIDALVSDLSDAAEYRSGVARWVEEGRRRSRGMWTGATLKMTPVNAAGPLRANLYRPAGRACDGGGDGEEAGLRSVALISATLPPASVSDAGVAQSARQLYPSPFTDAYNRSLLFVPRSSAGAGGTDAVTRPGGRGMDTSAHPAWALPIITALVESNGGSALVLAATTGAGQRYAEALRNLGAPWAVHSQWDGLALRGVVETWRNDRSSVLVGTKSLMTGVDAPGGTCSLVIVDRAPRAAGNPVDDARVADLAERLDIDRYAADRLVYVADACLLLEQAAGRLIRSVDDHGVVAVLDPRLLRVGALSYQVKTREMLLESLGRFSHRSADLEATCERLRAANPSSARPAMPRSA